MYESGPFGGPPPDPADVVFFEFLKFDLLGTCQRVTQHILQSRRRRRALCAGETRQGSVTPTRVPTLGPTTISTTYTISKRISWCVVWRRCVPRVIVEVSYPKDSILVILL